MHRCGLVERLAIAVVALPLACTPLAAADIFRVTEIPVDASAENAVAARQTALDAGQREGLRRLIERLSPVGARQSSAQLAALPIDRYVESFDIAGERVGPTRYLATLNVTYAPGQVEDLLRNRGQPFVDRRSEPLLVVPVWRTPDGDDLWSDFSPWRAAWNGIADVPTFLDLRLPLGDLSDVTTLTPDMLADDVPAAALDGLAERYGTEGVIVAVATPEPPPAGQPATAVEPGGPPAAQPVTIELRRADRWDRPFGRETVTPAADETAEALLARAVRQAVLAAEDDWKRRNLVPDDQLAGIAAVVPLVDLASWVQIRQRLAAIPGVRSVKVNSLARGRASVTIGYAGEAMQLAQAVERAGLVLAQENGEWLLRRAGDPPAYPQPQAVSPGTP